MIEKLNYLPDTSYLNEFHRQTLAEDQRYKQEILERHPTTFFRPGDRRAEAHPGFLRANEDGTSFIRFITKYGSHEQKVPPEFQDEEVSVKILSREAKRIREISRDECSNAYTELQDQDAVLVWLRQKYPNQKLSHASRVTVYTVDYVPQEKKSEEPQTEN